MTTTTTTDAPHRGRRTLAKRFGGTRAVDGVSLSAGRGVIGLLGPNGAGKTTLLRMVATVLAPDAGEPAAAGARPGRPAASGSRSGAGWATCRSRPALYPGFTPFDLVDYVAVLKEHTDRDWRRAGDPARAGVGRARGRDAPEDPPRSPAACGSGSRWRRRWSAAPTCWCSTSRRTGSTPSSGCSCARCSPQSQTVLMSTHNISEVSALCQRVYVMFSGRVRFAGTPAELAGAGRRPGLGGRPRRTRRRSAAG